ncbi:hypothetical protein KZZ52_42590 [Dactylosporangium sp. AC04546]|nr:hypothetical protein [Dactylosporangium sp. AC04546]WVK80604.1 hypothetical protein KZZ52_42590 [Dactylosporangium sp. AC04546]
MSGYLFKRPWDRVTEPLRIPVPEGAVTSRAHHALSALHAASAPTSG